jgi:membrane glycosyltransferase
MPVQRLDAPAPCPPILQPGVAGRRALILGGSGLLTALGAWVMVDVLSPAGFGAADLGLLALFCVLFSWVAFSFVGALAGFVRIWRQPRANWRPPPTVFTRTALLMPTYNEDPGRVLAAAEAMLDDLESLGVGALYDVFLLSDTRDPDIARAEAGGVLRVRLRTGHTDRLYYRRRVENREKKAGNIADWVRRFGAAYESMIILDADSLMTGRTIVELTARMRADPQTGLIQTLPTIVGARTLFARLQQFAGRLYGPIIAQGQDWWSGAEGNYWGHNAIIRVKAFAACAGLPHLDGGKPFGGHILSHDFVEAALLRRGGWAVRMAGDLEGSYEEAPPTLVDMAVRDRRWCQGNMQHAAVLGGRGFHWISRLHLGRGVLAYVTAPLWLAFMALGAVVWVQQSAVQSQTNAAMAAGLFGLSLALLAAPKLMGLVVAMRDRSSLRGFGGRLRLVIGFVIEQMVSTLAAAVLMLMQSRSVVDVLMGRDSGWNAQHRDEGDLTLRDAWRWHRRHTRLGLIWIIATGVLDPLLLAWTAPAAVGLMLSVPLTVWTSKTSAGAVLARLGLLRTAEDIAPPTVITRAAALRATYDAEAGVRRQIDSLMAGQTAFYEPRPWATV